MRASVGVRVGVRVRALESRLGRREAKLLHQREYDPQRARVRAEALEHRAQRPSEERVRVRGEGEDEGEGEGEGEGER